ncbi:kinase-like domain-containing protein [Mycena amicta]|nr:kinase-like domain-containing protein [Mycena amicta]
MPMRVHIDSLIDYGGFCMFNPLLDDIGVPFRPLTAEFRLRGRVYVGQVKTSEFLPVESKIALKKMHITKHVKNAMLMHEAAALLKLRGHESVPSVYAWGRSQYYEYLALQLLGPTLSISSAPTMRNLVAVTCQMFDAIEHVHKHGFIHGDIKPDNFLFGTGKDGSDIGRIYLIDYGLAKLYADPRTFTHVSNGTIPSLRGTPVYASLNMHYHRMPSRRDDMESLAYSILKLLRGSLPWRHVDSNEALRLKATSTGTALCGEYPPVFGEFLEYARGMSFEETPDYKKWRARFRQLRQSFFPDVQLGPSRVKDEDLLGDEREIVARELETFDGPPQMDAAELERWLLEVMEPS